MTRPLTCVMCSKGQVVVGDEEIRFRQETDRGTVECVVVVPIGRCIQCNFAHVDEAADARMDEAVRQSRIKMA